MDDEVQDGAVFKVLITKLLPTFSWSFRLLRIFVLSSKQL